MNTLLIILSFLCIIAGVIGSVAPGLPGPPLAWIGLLLAGLTPYADCSTWLLVGTAIVALLITVLDYVIPSLSTKRFRGSKYGIWGCNIGLIISIFGLPFGPQGLLGVVLWPFVGALVGEYIHIHNLRPAMKAATGAFLGFLCGSFLKVVYCVALLVVTVVKII